MHMNDMGNNMSGSIGGKFVSMNVTGNDIHCSNGLSFNLIGDTLTCSDGSHWFGVSDMEEAKRVAAMHMR